MTAAEPRQQRGDPWPPWGLAPPVIGFVAGLVLAVVLGSSVFAITGSTESLATLVASLVGLWLGYLGAAVLATQRPMNDGATPALRFRFRAVDVPLGIAVGLGTSVVVVRLVYLLLVLAGLVSTRDLEALSDPAERVSGLATGSGWVLLFVLVGVGAPVVEEVFYRGLLQPVLIQRLGPVPGIALTALVFGAAHQQALQFPALAAFGAILGWLAWRWGRLGPAIVAHVTFNILTLVQLALSS